MSALATVLLVIAIIGTGTVAGVFFAFSGFVVSGLDRLPPAEAARAMQEINVTAPRPPLMIALFGTALVVAGLAVLGFLGQLGGAAAWIWAATAIYLVTAVGVTAGANVPRNDRLASAPEGDRAALASAWAAFRPGWTRWNHVRWLGSTAACGCLVAALLV